MGGGWKAVADSLGCSKEEAQGFVKSYAEGFPGVTAFKEKGSRHVRNHGYVLICKHTGMKIWWEDFEKWKTIENMSDYEQKMELTSDERKEHSMAGAKWDRMSLNSPTQGTGIEILKLSMSIYFKWIVDNGYFNKVLLCDLVHDEAVIEAPKDLIQLASDKLKQAMEKGASKLCTSLPIPAIPEIGDHWIH